MNNQLIKKEDLSFLDKIKIFFKKYFSKKDKIEYYNGNENAIPIEVSNTTYDCMKKNTFNESLKVANSEEYIKEQKTKENMKRIEENPDVIDSLSDDKLDRIINYYENITNTKRNKIEKLKKALN